MFNKIKDMIKRRKNSKKNKCDNSILESAQKEVTNISQLKENKQKFEENKQKDTKKHEIENSNYDSNFSSNVIDFNKYRKEKILVKKNIDKFDIKNDKMVKKFLENENCYECNSEFTSSVKISSISNSGDYRYICCSRCGCIMKLHSDCNITNSRNILKEVSDAYALFKKVNINAKSYSYTRNGDRHYF